MISWSDALSLGRVSNLPTVWTNMLAAVVLVGGVLSFGKVAPLLIALSLFYIGGMYLNDAFDAQIDARERPDRPIPSGRVSVQTVYAWGFGMLALSAVLVAWIGVAVEPMTGWRPIAAAVCLGLCIVAYNKWHKGNAFSPVVMGLCRVFVYITAAYCVATQLNPPVLYGAVILLCYLIGLTYIAKQENLNHVGNLWPLIFLGAPVVYGLVIGVGNPSILVYLVIFTAWMLVALWFVKRRAPGDIPRAVVSLIAGMCLLDAMLIAGQGYPGLALLAVVGFLLTLYLQRYIAGT